MTFTNGLVELLPEFEEETGIKVNMELLEEQGIRSENAVGACQRHRQLRRCRYRKRQYAPVWPERLGDSQ